MGLPGQKKKKKENRKTPDAKFILKINDPPAVQVSWEMERSGQDSSPNIHVYWK